MTLPKANGNAATARRGDTKITSRTVIGTLLNAAAKATNLPLSTLIPDYKAERLNTVGLAKVDGEVAVTSPVVVADVDAGTNWKKLGLWVVLLLGVAALGAMAYSLLRKPPVAR